MSKSNEPIEIGKQIGSAVGDVLHGAAAFFGLDSLAQQSIRKICEWAGVKDMSYLWKVGTTDQMINWLTNQLKKSKIQSSQVLTKIQNALDNLPPALSENVANVVNAKFSELKNKQTNALSLEKKAEEAESKATTEIYAQGAKLSGDRVHNENKMATAAAEAKKAYQSIYELGKDY